MVQDFQHSRFKTSYQKVFVKRKYMIAMVLIVFTNRG